MSEPAAGPLSGLRILDLSRLLPGGYCTLLMADLGADVIKVEEPGRGDPMRDWPPYDGDEAPGAFLALGRGKRSVTCNLRTEGGRQVLRRLAATADVLVESFRPGVMARLGVGERELRADNPGLVYVSISGYGADGPRAAIAGHDLNYLAVGGALSFTGAAGGPLPAGLQIADIGGGLLALVAVLAALRVRDRSGEGQFCDVSMTDAIVSFLSMHAGATAVSDRSPRPGRELLNGGYACYGVYRCRDGRFLAVGALEPRFFRTLAAELGVPEVAEHQYDRARQPELRARLAEIFVTADQAVWTTRLGLLDACVAPVLDVGETLRDPALRARGAVVDTALPAGRTLPMPGVVPKLSATPGRPGGPPPGLGADTDRLLGELGYSPAELAALRAAGAT